MWLYIYIYFFLNGGAIYREVMCILQDAFFRIIGDLIHHGLNNKGNLSVIETEKPRGKAGFETGWCKV